MSVRYFGIFALSCFVWVADPIDACAESVSADHCPPLEPYTTSAHPGSGTSWFGGYRILSCDGVMGGGQLDQDGTQDGIIATLDCDNCTENCTNEGVDPPEKPCGLGTSSSFTEKITWTWSGSVTGSAEGGNGWASKWLAEAKVKVEAKFAGERASEDGKTHNLNFEPGPVMMPPCQWAKYYKGLKIKKGRTASVTITVTPDYEVYCNEHESWFDISGSKESPQTITLTAVTDCIIGSACDDTLANGECTEANPEPNFPPDPDPWTHVCGTNP